MAVRKQYPCLDSMVLPNNNASSLDEFHPYHNQQMLNGKVLSEQESLLTCNMSGSRTRNRLHHFQKPPPPESQMIHPLFFHLQDLNSNLLLPNPEIDALIQLKNEKLRVGLEEMRKRQCKSLLSVLEKQVVKKLQEKETELANINSRNAELEEKIKQISAENQIWFNVANDNKALVSSLRSNLEQIILNNQNQNQINEGFGDSEGVAGDTQSSCNEDDGKEYIAEEMIRENSKLKQRICCKVCYENEISVLLLPCLHLCLCKQCEPKINSCPICKSSTNASLQVFIS